MGIMEVRNIYFFQKKIFQKHFSKIFFFNCNLNFFLFQQIPQKLITYSTVQHLNWQPLVIHIFMKVFNFNFNYNSILVQKLSLKKTLRYLFTNMKWKRWFKIFIISLDAFAHIVHSQVKGISIILYCTFIRILIQRKK